MNTGRLIFFLSALTFVAGCNGDVFIDGFLDGDMTVSVEGDGGTATVYFESGDWDVLEVLGPGGHFLSGEIYGADGKLSRVDWLMTDGLGRLHYDDGMVDFSIERNTDDRLDILLSENMRPDCYTISVIVGNGYDNSTVTVELQPSSGYIVDGIEYDMENFHYSDNTAEIVDAFTVVNSGSTEMSVVSYPYRGVEHTFEFDLYAEGSVTLAGETLFGIFRGDYSEVPVPEIEDGKPYIGNLELPFKGGVQNVSLPQGMKDTSEKVTVEPGCSKRVEVLVVYEEFTVPCTVNLSNPATGRKRVLDGRLHSLKPYDFYILKSDPEER